MPKHARDAPIKGPKFGKKMRKSKPERRIAASGEKKGLDTLMTIAGPISASASANTDSFVMNLVVPGTGSMNRIGRKINNKSLRLRGTAAYRYALQTTTNNVSQAILRMVVVWDSQPSGVLPAWDVIFGITDQAGAETSTILAPPKYDNMDRFTVLKDVTIVPNEVGTLPATGGTGGNVINNIYHYDEYISLGNRETVYQAGAGTIADISSGGLYVFYRASADTNDIADWSISSSSFGRLRYSDK